MKNILLLLFVVATMTSFSQTKKATVKWGKEFKESRKSTLGDIISSDKKSFYTVRTKRKGFVKQDYFFESFSNSTLSKTNSYEFEMKKGKNKLAYEDVIDFGGDLYLITNEYIKKTKQMNLYAQKINKSTLKPSTKFIKISQFKFEKGGRRNRGNFNVELSKDESKLLVYYNLPYKKNEQEVFGLHVFEKGFKKLWNKEVKLPYDDWEFVIEDYGIDNNGNIYLTGLKYDEKPVRKGIFSKRNSKPIYHYEILTYVNKGEDIKKYPIKIKDYFLTDMQVDINNKNQIVCGGFYSAIGSFAIKGSYFITLDSEDQGIESKSFKDFGIDFITQHLSNRKAKKAKKKKKKGKNVEMYNYKLDDIIFKDDGSAYLIAEQYYVIVTTTTVSNGNGGTTTKTTYTYYYNDIIVVNMDSNGEVEWTVKIPKKQVSTNDGGFYSSYVTHLKDDKLFFVFNDNIKNLNYKEGDKIYDGVVGKRQSIAVLVELNKDGSYKKEQLFKSKEAETMIRPKVCEQKNENNLLLYGQKGKKQKFANVKFK